MKQLLSILSIFICLIGACKEAKGQAPQEYKPDTGYPTLLQIKVDGVNSLDILYERYWKCMYMFDTLFLHGYYNGYYHGKKDCDLYHDKAAEYCATIVEKMLWYDTKHKPNIGEMILLQTNDGYLYKDKCRSEHIKSISIYKRWAYWKKKDPGYITDFKVIGAKKSEPYGMATFRNDFNGTDINKFDTTGSIYIGKDTTKKDSTIFITDYDPVSSGGFIVSDRTTRDCFTFVFRYTERGQWINDSTRCNPTAWNYSGKDMFLVNCSKDSLMVIDSAASIKGLWFMIQYYQTKDSLLSARYPYVNREMDARYRKLKK